MAETQGKLVRVPEAPVQLRRLPPRSPREVTYEGPELRLGRRAQVPPEAPILDPARRRMALTTTASGAIG